MDLESRDLIKHGFATLKDKQNFLFYDCETVLNSVLKEIPPNTTVNILIPEENHLASGEIPDNISQQMLSQNITINFLFGGFSKYNWTEKYDRPSENRHLYLWSTGPMFISVGEILEHYSIEELRSYKNNQFKFPFVSLSGKAKSHRCYLIDQLFKEKLLEKGLYTWANTFYQPYSYTWEYADPKKLTKFLDDRYGYNKNYVTMPNDYFNSFAHLVSEGIFDGQFITEKTTVPLMHKKPFIVQGIEGFHKILLQKELKFELYEEIFDYSFDDNPDWKVRTDAVIKNIKRLLNTDLSKLYEKIYPKLVYNQNRMIEIVNKNIGVPDIVLQSPVMIKKYPILTKKIV